MEYNSFFSAKLNQVWFVEVAMVRCQFVSAHLSEVEFLSCSLPESSFLSARVERTLLWECDLTNALFAGSQEAFIQERCSENRKTAPVIILMWSHIFPLRYARQSYELLRKMEVIPLLVEFKPTQIDPALLKEEVEDHLARTGQGSTWSLGKEIVRSAAAESEVGKLVALAKEIVEEVDAVLIPGGSDIEPEVYGEPRLP